jgi:hypothetical protein
VFRPVDSQLAAWAIVGMLERAIYYAVFIDEHADLDHLVDDLVRLELGGLLIAGWEDHLSSGHQQRSSCLSAATKKRKRCPTTRRH